MKSKKTIAILILTLLLASLSLGAQEDVKKPDMSNKKLTLKDKGEVLVRTLWKNMKQGNIKQINESTSPSFQSLHQDGVRDRQEEIVLISKLNLGEYKLSNFTITHSSNLIIVSYTVTVDETIDEKRLKGESTPRTSIFQKINGKWLWIYHVNPLKLS